MSGGFKNVNGRYINFEALKELANYNSNDFVIIGSSRTGRDYKIPIDTFFSVATELSLIAAGGDGSGNVVGPSSSTDSRIALFNGTTGKLLKVSSYSESTIGDLITDVNTAIEDIALIETSISSLIPTSQKGAANGVAPLNASSKIDQTYLPSIAIVDVYTVNSEVNQLALDAQEGDVAIRTDESKSYVRNGGTAGTMSDWSELISPTDGVTSVALSLPNIFSISGSPITSSGTITATLANQLQNLVFASPNGSTGAPTFRALVIADVSGLQTALDAKAPTADPTFTGTVTAAAIKGYRPTSTQTGTTYIFVLGDANTMILANNASAQTYTIPNETDVDFPIGTEIEVFNYGAGIVTFDPDTEVTLHSKGALLSMSDQYAAAIIKKIAADEWILIGDLA